MPLPLSLNFDACNVCVSDDIALARRIKLKSSAMENKRVANLAFYQRGMAALCKQVAHKIRTRRLDNDAYEVALTGTQINSHLATCKLSSVLSDNSTTPYASD